MENNSDELFVDAVEDHIPDINTQQMEQFSRKTIENIEFEFDSNISGEMEQLLASTHTTKACHPTTNRGYTKMNIW